MEQAGIGARFRHRKTPSSDRLLGIVTRSQPATAAGDELSEDDVFWTGGYSSEQNRRSTPTSSASSSPSANVNHHPHQSKNFGILAVLPESETRSVFNHKASVSSSSSTSPASSSRMIPKRPPVDRLCSVKYPHSAPVNVPVLSEAMQRRREASEFDDIDNNDDQEDGEMLPPHEIMAARQTPRVASSVLEGVGRTLKGRDQRQVRNAVWQKTGFLD